MKIPSIWFWESLENLPLILGFVAAARLWQENPLLALILLLAGMGLGVLTTHLFEPRLHPGTYRPRWTSSLLNFLLFSALSIPFLYYFRLESPWLNWKTDLLAGVCAGILLTLGQSAVWRGKKARIVLHGLAMTVSIPLLLLGLRYIIRLEDSFAAFGLATLLTLGASLIITLIDYQEMYRKKE
jgi:hypothetical protein